MYTRAALIAALFFSGTNAQLYCLSCTNTNALGSAADLSNGECYFTSTLDTTDLSASTNAVQCDDADGDATGSNVAGDGIFVGGSCFMKMTSIDGIPQSIERGCIAFANIANDASIATALGLPSGQPMGCDIDVIGDVDGVTLTHIDAVTNLFNPNLDINTLSDATCGWTCTAGGTTACNMGGSFEFNTLHDCGAQCGTVSTCDHWTGVCESFNCPVGQQASLVSGEYVCAAATCAQNCGTDATCSINNVVSLIGEFVTPFCKCNTADSTFTADPTDSVANPGTCAAAPVTTAPVVALKKCVQCSSDTMGSACSAGTATATDCAAGNDKCAAVSTLWIDADGKSIREVVERGCTNDAVTTDTCEFQEINTLPSTNQASAVRFTGATEMTCRYVCDPTTSGDGCNNQMADGVDTSFVASMLCNVGVKCDSLASCKTITATTDITDTSSQCAGKCWSRMKYFQHMRADMTWERAMTHLEFGCDTMDMYQDQHQCTSAVIGIDSSGFSSQATTDFVSSVRSGVWQYDCWSVDSVAMVTGWPGQPKCFQCSDTETTSNGGVDVSANDNWCFSEVEMATGCPNYFENACYVMQTGLDLTSNWAAKSMNPYSAMQSMGAPRAVSRSCTTATEAIVEMDTPAATRNADQNQNLYWNRRVTCLEDMCNFGPALPSPPN